MGFTLEGISFYRCFVESDPLIYIEGERPWSYESPSGYKLIVFRLIVLSFAVPTN